MVLPGPEPDTEPGRRQPDHVPADQRRDTHFTTPPGTGSEAKGPIDLYTAGRRRQ